VGYLPFSYKKVKVKGPLAPKVYSRLKFTEVDPTNKTIAYDGVIMDEKGIELLDIEGLTFSRLDEITPAAAPQVPKQKSKDKDTADLQDHELLRDGLSSAEGAEVFNRILETHLPQVVVSVKDFNQVLELQKSAQQAEIPGKAKDPAALFPRPQLGTAYAPPETDIEKKLVRVFQDFFGIREVGVNDNFFELGGDSLDAVTMVTRFHKELEVKMSLAELLKAPSVRELAGIIKESSKEKYIPIEPAEKKEYYPLSSAQKRFYFLHQMKDQNITYNFPQKIMIDSDISKEKLEQTFRELVKRYESLRTSFEMVGRELVQRVHEHVDFEVEYHDLEADNNADADTRAREIVESFIRSFDLAKPPLWNVVFIKMKESRNIFLFNIHHVISDVSTAEIIISDFGALNEGMELPPVKLQYRDYSEWQHSGIYAQRIKKQREYWLNLLAGEVPRLNLPLDSERGAVQEFTGGDVNFIIGRETTEALKALASKEEANLNILLLSLFYILMWKMTRQEDILVGLPMAGRSHSDLERIVGAFVNSVVVRNSPSPDKTAGQFIAEVKKSVFEAVENQDYQFDDLVSDLGLNNETNRNPLFDVAFSLITVDSPAAKTNNDMPADKSSLYEMVFEISYIDLILFAFDIDNQLTCRFNYDAALFKRTTIEEIKDYYLDILEQVLNNPFIKLKDIAVSKALLTAGTNILENETLDYQF
jgi:acyl carrier protein